MPALGAAPSTPVGDARGVPVCESAERSSCWIAERTSVRNDEEVPGPGTASEAAVEVCALDPSPVLPADDGGPVTGLSMSLCNLVAGRMVQHSTSEREIAQVNGRFFTATLPAILPAD